MLLFIIYIIIWVYYGLAMIITMDKWEKTNNINLYGIAFFIMAPFIPIVAKFSGIL